MMVGAVVHACVRAYSGNIRYAVILGALPSLLRQHGAVDAQGQPDEKAAKRLRVCCVFATGAFLRVDISEVTPM